MSLGQTWIAHKSWHDIAKNLLAFKDIDWKICTPHDKCNTWQNNQQIFSTLRQSAHLQTDVDEIDRGIWNRKSSFRNWNQDASIHQSPSKPSVSPPKHDKSSSQATIITPSNVRVCFSQKRKQWYKVIVRFTNHSTKHQFENARASKPSWTINYKNQSQIMTNHGASSEKTWSYRTFIVGVSNDAKVHL